VRREAAHGNADAVAVGTLHPPPDRADTESEVKNGWVGPWSRHALYIQKL